MKMKVFLCLVLSATQLSGCVSTGGELSRSIPAEYCNEQGCSPNAQRVEAKWGPIKLDGGLSLLNIFAVLNWGEEIDAANSAATKEIVEKENNIDCGPACDKHIKTKISVSCSINPGEADMEDPECKAAFSTTLSASGVGLTCALAYPAALQSINDAVAAAGELCKAHNPKCTAGSVEIISSSDDQSSPLTITEEPTILGCTVKVAANVKVRCGKGDTKPISSLAASGEMISDVTCTKPKKCEEAVPDDEEQQDDAEPSSQGFENLNELRAIFE